jgi:hypothetical protein
MAIIGDDWSYSGDPATDSKDAVRWLITDTDTTNQRIGDREILFALGQGGGIYKAAAACCRVIGQQNPGESISVSVGDMSDSVSGEGASWASLADYYEGRAAGSGSPAAPIAGGTSIASKASRVRDTDRAADRAWFGQFDHPETVLQRPWGEQCTR